MENYKIVDVPTPEPGPGQVLVRVGACSVGYVDALEAIGGYQTKPPLPHTPGREVSGVVEAVGEGVTGFEIGTRVLTRALAAFAQFAIATAGDVKKLPDTFSGASAAVLRGNYLTAMHALEDRGMVKAGEIVLVIGAAGGVGLAAVEVAKALGATVIGVASTPEKREAVKAAGADEVLDTQVDGWRDRLKALAPNGIDVVYDPVCGPLLQPSFRSLRWRGRYLVVGFAAGEIPSLPLNLPLVKGASIVGIDCRQFAAVFDVEEADRMVDRLLVWAGEGRISPPVGRRFAFGDYAELLEFAMSGKAIGKSLLIVDETLA
ncbi:quinone oxidoreductase [Oceanicola sp. 22II-s10i]|nr:quinone oxidoreductase [Oceanicola sp. 22II-s10i]